MPLARIEIEQIEANRWVAEIEAGGLPGCPQFKRRTLSNQDFSNMIAAVCDAYFEQVPSAKPEPAAKVEAKPEPPAATPRPPPQPENRSAPASGNMTRTGSR